MNEIHIVQMFICVIYLPWIMSNCAQHFCSTNISSTTNHDTILTSKCIWSYLSQFSTVFDNPGSEIDGIMCGSPGV
jgi:hypothetical protein